MGEKITSAHDFAIELRDYISENALRDEELISFAESIGYPFDVLDVNNRMVLTNELVFFHTFFGSFLLEVCFSEHPEIPKDVVDGIIKIYKENLLKQWLPDSMLSDYDKRLDKWKLLFKNLQDEYQYAQDMLTLIRSFYKFLTNNSCDALKEASLSLRFNSYAKIFIESIHAMIDDFSI